MTSPAEKSGEIALKAAHDWISAHCGLLPAIVFDSALPMILVLMTFYAVLLRQGNSKNQHSRDEYIQVRKSYSEGGFFAVVYVRELTRWLDLLDHFLHDHDKAALTAWPHIFRWARGGTSPYPLWTGASYARCMQLALLYVFLTIILFWAISGEQGPAERALGLAAHVSPFDRCALILSIVAAAFGFWRVARLKGWKSWLWVPVAGAVSGFGAVSGYIVVAAIVAIATAFADAGNRQGGAVLSIAVAINLTFSGILVGPAVVVVVVVTAFLLFALYIGSIHAKRQGVFLAVYSLIAITSIFAASSQAFRIPDWQIAGALLLFFYLLILINAFFDWIAIGLTRALLRRGVEKGGWAPLRLALWDFVFAVALVVSLAGTLVIAIQAFDYFSVKVAGEKSIFSVRETLDALRAQPDQPKFWWIYATLFSTFLPSFCNLTLACVSLTRGIPRISRWVAASMPEDHAPSPFTTIYLSVTMAFQAWLGVVLACIAVVGLALVATREASPVGLMFLEYAQHVERFEVTRRIDDSLLHLKKRSRRVY